MKFKRIAFTLLSFWLCIFPIKYYLVLNRPVKSEYLIVEFWISDYAMNEALNIFKKGLFDKLIVPVIVDNEIAGKEEKNYRQLIDDKGISQQKLEILKGPHINKHRTISQALMVEKWFMTKNYNPSSINVVTETVHGRKTLITYKRVFRKETKIGIYSVDTNQYDMDRWYFSPLAIKYTIKNFIGCFYASTVNLAHQR